MLDAQGRIKISKEILSRNDDINLAGKVHIYYDADQKGLLVSSQQREFSGNVYYLITHSIDVKGRIFVPISIRKAFPNATYLPAEKKGKIYILIFDHEKKSE